LIYVHIPFCRSFCSYCSFYSSTKTREIPGVLDCISLEWIRDRDLWLNIFRSAEPAPGHTLYFGGGTPTVCAASELCALITFLRKDMEQEGLTLAELTVEANPGDLTPEYCHSLLDAGANRLSIGVQSFHDAYLEAMRRRHNGRQAADSAILARQAGFANISLDLIFGFPGLTAEKWKDTLAQAVALAPEHISAYQLSLEPSSPWGKKGVLPPQEECALQYALLQEALQRAGYIQYEVSSFCLPGKESLHNSRYWTRRPYAGLGPSAHSFDGKDRYANVANLKKYTSGIRQNAPVRRYDRLTTRDVHNERIMLSLRTCKGLSLTDMERVEGKSVADDFLKQITPLLERGLLIRTGNKVRIPADRLFVSDDIIRDCLLPL
jgi:oxygen-independent coproporphyrinogen-3 oxidase